MIRIAGIGPRKITPEGIELVTHVAEQLAQLGFHMNSGHGTGADQAWAAPFPDGQKSIYLPWWGFNGALPDDNTVFKLARLRFDYIELASAHHKGWDKLPESIKHLMVRNVAILLSGQDDTKVDAVVYWQESNINIHSRGGTQHALRVAQSLQIPCFNVNTDEGQAGLDKWVTEKLF